MQKTEIAQKLSDATFQAALLANPHQALRKAGVEIPSTTEVKVVRNSKNSVNLVIPSENASDTGLSDDQLGSLSAGEIIFAVLAVVGVGAIVAGGVAGTTYLALDASES